MKKNRTRVGAFLLAMVMLFTTYTFGFDFGGRHQDIYIERIPSNVLFFPSNILFSPLNVLFFLANVLFFSHPT